MKNNELLLSKSGPKPIRVHNGKVITLHSNTRWCSDGFVISCDNGDKVYLAFSMDNCDREVLCYIVSTKGIDGEMIRDLNEHAPHKGLKMMSHRQYIRAMS